MKHLNSEQIKLVAQMLTDCRNLCEQADSASVAMQAMDRGVKLSLWLWDEYGWRLLF